MADGTPGPAAAAAAQRRAARRPPRWGRTGRRRVLGRLPGPRPRSLAQGRGHPSLGWGPVPPLAGSRWLSQPWAGGKCALFRFFFKF